MSDIDRDIEHITVRVGDLEIEVRRSRGSSDPDLGFERVEPAPGASSEHTSDAAVLEAVTPEDLGALDLPQLEPFTRGLSDRGAWTAKARAARAYRAGLTARQCLDSVEERLPLTTPTVPGLRNCIYIILTGPRLPTGGWTRRYSAFAAAVRGPAGETFAKGVICHSFASQAEADCYLLGAGKRWPPPLAA